MAAICHLGFFKFKVLTSWKLKGDPFYITMPNFVKYSNFSICSINMVAVAILD